MRRFVSPLLFVLLVFAAPAVSNAQISAGISITIAPPALPVYVQPACPAVGYIWTPGYWAYDQEGGYYFVPGTWVAAPTPGVLWTPGYWGWSGGVFAWNAGYWGPHVGFYGGVNYGFGYGGVGYGGGYWNNGAFYYNRSVNNIGSTTNITNVYNKTVINNTTNVTRVSYNGGNGGTTARPTATELAAAREPHTPPTPLQTHHVEEARANPAQFASRNHGSPAVAATAKPAVFSGAGVVRATRAGAPYHAAANPPVANRSSPRTVTPAAGAHPAVAHPNNATARPAAKPAASPHGTPPPRAATRAAAATRPAATPARPNNATARPAAKPAAAPHGTPPARPPSRPAAQPSVEKSRPAPEPAPRAPAARPAPAEKKPPQ